MDKDIDGQIRRVEGQIQKLTRLIEGYQLTRSIFELILRELKGLKVVDAAERIVKEGIRDKG